MNSNLAARLSVASWCPTECRVIPSLRAQVWGTLNRLALDVPDSLSVQHSGMREGVLVYRFIGDIRGVKHRIYESFRSALRVILALTILLSLAMAANNPDIGVGLNVGGAGEIKIGQGVGLTATLVWPSSVTPESGTFTWTATPDGLVTIDNPVQTGSGTCSVVVTGVRTGRATVKVKWVPSSGNCDSPEGTKAITVIQSVTLNGSYSVTSMQKLLLGELNVWDPAIQDFRPGYLWRVGANGSAFIGCSSNPSGGIVHYTRKVGINEIIIQTHEGTLEEGQRDDEANLIWAELQIFAYQLGSVQVTGTASVQLGAPVNGWIGTNSVDTSRVGNITL